MSAMPEDDKALVEAGKSLEEAITSQYAQFDKALLTLSSGGLALLLAFIEKITPHPAPCTKWLFYFAVVCFCIAILVTVASFFYSIFSHHVSCVSIQRIRQGKPSLRPDDSYVYEALTPRAAVWLWIKAYWLGHLMNFVAFFAFLSGVGLAVVFILINLW